MIGFSRVTPGQRRRHPGRVRGASPAPRGRQLPLLWGPAAPRCPPSDNRQVSEGRPSGQRGPGSQALPSGDEAPVHACPEGGVQSCPPPRWRLGRAAGGRPPLAHPPASSPCCSAFWARCPDLGSPAVRGDVPVPERAWPTLPCGPCSQTGTSDHTTQRAPQETSGEPLARPLSSPVEGLSWGAGLGSSGRAHTLTSSPMGRWPLQGPPA